jgi:hypothetical protein
MVDGIRNITAGLTRSTIHHGITRFTTEHPQTRFILSKTTYRITRGAKHETERKSPLIPLFHHDSALQ